MIINSNAINKFKLNSKIIALKDFVSHRGDPIKKKEILEKWLKR